MRSLTFNFSEKVHHVSWPELSMKLLCYSHHPVKVLSWGTSPFSDAMGIDLPTDTDPNLPVRVYWAGEARASLLPAQRPWPVWWRDPFVHSVSSPQHHRGLGPDPVHLLWQDGDADREQDGVQALYHHGPRVFSPRKWYEGFQGLPPLF